MADVNAEDGTTPTGEDRLFGSVSKGYTQFSHGDILVAKITPCFENGKIAQANLRHLAGAGSTEFHVVRPDRTKLDDRYLLRFLRQPRIRLAGELRMTGSAGQRRVPAAFLADLDIHLPPLPDQRRIAELLDWVDALRAQRRRAIALLDDLARSTFLDMFGDPARNEHGWRRAPLRELVSKIESGKSPRCLSRPAAEGEWGVLKLGAVTGCEYKPAENKALPPAATPFSVYEIMPGDLLVSRKNTRELVGDCALVWATPPRLLMPDLIFRLVLRQDSAVERTYLHRLLIDPAKRALVRSLASGSAGSMPNISKARLLGLVIELPPLDLQKTFASRVRAAGLLKETHRASLAELDGLFAVVQHRAFRGELWDDPAQ